MEALRAARMLGSTVDPPEHQRGVTEIELVEALDEGLVEGVALETGLHRAAEVRLIEVSQAPRRRLRRLQAVVGKIDVGLFGVQFWVLLGQTFPSTSRGRNWGLDMVAGVWTDRPGPCPAGRLTWPVPRSPR